MSQQQNSAGEQEIDLSIIGKRLKSVASGLEAGFFSLIFLIKRYIIVLAIIFIGGAALGYYLDKTGKTYKSEMIVIPNFGSTEQLYSQVDLVQSKVNENDTAFIKQMGILPKKLVKISIEPINNVYDFANQRPTNFELLKLMAEDGSITKVIEDEVTSKNYLYHKIVFVTRGVTDRAKTLEPLMKFFNNSAYFDEIKKQQAINLEEKIRLNDSVISQIDQIIEEFRKSSSSGAKSSSLVYYNENTQLSDILKRKDELINETASLKISRINHTAIVKEVASSVNIRNKNGMSGKMKFVVPIVLTFIILVLIVIISYIKRGLKRNTL